MAPVDRLLAVQDRRIASLSPTTTLIIQHDDSECSADATRQALRHHRAGRSCIEVLKDGFALVDGGHASAAAGGRAGPPPTQPEEPSPSDGGGSGSSGSSGGGGSNSSISPSESGGRMVEVVEAPQSRRRELLRLASDRGFTSTEPAAKRRCAMRPSGASAGVGTQLLARGNWEPWVPTEQGGTTQGARGHPGRWQASGAQREHGARGSGTLVGVAAYSLSAAEARERAYYAQQEREQTQAMEEEAAAQHQGHARLGAVSHNQDHAEDLVDTLPPASPPPTEPSIKPPKVPGPPRTNHRHPTLTPPLIPSSDA